MKKIRVRAIKASDRPWIRDLLRRKWGSVTVISRGNKHGADRLPGFVAEGENRRLGLVTYQRGVNEWEIITLDSLREKRGVGTALLHAVQRGALRARCRRVILVTTNDNTDALRFYQKRGFLLVALHRLAASAARKLKPEIPLLGCHGIPVRDEIELKSVLPRTPLRSNRAIRK